MKRNRKLLLKTARRITKVPESYNQHEWVMDSDRSPCGTVACLAGEIIICSEPTVKKGVERLKDIYHGEGSVATEAIELTGLDEDDEDALFYSPKTWPNGIGKRFARKTKVEKAKAAAELLRYLADGGEV